MAANVPNPGAYLSQLGGIFVQIRELMRDVQDQSDYIASMGGAAFLTAAYPAGLGLSEDDANALIAALGNHANLAVMYQGGPVAAQFDYEANGQPFWGGQ